MAALRSCGRSSINSRHDPIRVTPPRDFSGCQSVVEHLHLCEIKLDALRGHILFKIFPAFGAGDRHDVVAFSQYPGKRDLPGLRMLGRGDLPHDSRRLHIGVVILTLIPRVDTSEITFRILFSAFDLASEEAAPKRTKWYETDGEFAQNRNNLRLQIPFP